MLLPPLPVSVTVTLEVELDGSMATVTKIVFPTATFTDDTAKLLAVELSDAVPMFVSVMVETIVMLSAPEDAETFPNASVAVAVIRCVPTLSALVAVTPILVLA